MRKAVILKDDEMVIPVDVYESLVEESQMFWLARSMLTSEQMKGLEEAWKALDDA